MDKQRVARELVVLAEALAAESEMNEYSYWESLWPELSLKRSPIRGVTLSQIDARGRSGTGGTAVGEIEHKNGTQFFPVKLDFGVYDQGRGLRLSAWVDYEWDGKWKSLEGADKRATGDVDRDAELLAKTVGLALKRSKKYIDSQIWPE